MVQYPEYHKPVRVAGTPVIIKEGEDDEDDPKSGNSAVGRNTTTFNLGKKIGGPYVGWIRLYLQTYMKRFGKQLPESPTVIPAALLTRLTKLK